MAENQTVLIRIPVSLWILPIHIRILAPAAAPKTLSLARGLVTLGPCPVLFQEKAPVTQTRSVAHILLQTAILFLPVFIRSIFQPVKINMETLFQAIPIILILRLVLRLRGGVGRLIVARPLLAPTIKLPFRINNAMMLV